eukprot:2649950-Rhodomonas_salina.1
MVQCLVRTNNGYWRALSGTDVASAGTEQAYRHHRARTKPQLTSRQPTRISPQLSALRTLTPLLSAAFIAAEKGNIECLLVLAQASADLSTADAQTGRTPAYVLAFGEHLEALKALAEKDADMSSPDTQVARVRLMREEEWGGGMCDVGAWIHVPVPVPVPVPASVSVLVSVSVYVPVPVPVSVSVYVPVPFPVYASVSVSVCGGCKGANDFP